VLQTKRSRVHHDGHAHKPVSLRPGVVSRPQGHLVDRAQVRHHVYPARRDSPAVELLDERVADGDDRRCTACYLTLCVPRDPADERSQRAQPISGNDPVASL